MAPAKTYQRYTGKEDQLQTATADYLRYKYPNILAFHTPNGGHRLKAVAAKLKRQGVTPGVPDWLIIKPSGPYCGLAIELKVKGGSLTPAQKDVLACFNTSGWAIAVVWCLDEFIDVTNNYFNGT